MVLSGSDDSGAVRPLIGLTTYLQRAQTGVWDTRAAYLPHVYFDAVTRAGGIAVLTLFFRRNRASLRFWLWFTASVKFLVPFAALAMLGTYLSHLFPTPLPPSILAIQPAAERLSMPTAN